MIYLIDEKKERQLKYGWNIDNFLKYKNVITTISDYNELKHITSKAILENPSNVILLHDSFFKNLEISSKVLKGFKNSIENSGLRYVTFGGSFDSTYYDDKILQLNVKQFYLNLESFVEISPIDLRILAYGINFEKEEFLTIKTLVWNFLFRYTDLHRLSSEEKYQLLTAVKFNELLTEIVDTCESVAEIKTLLNKWKI